MIYGNLESNLKEIYKKYRNNSNKSHSIKYQDYITCSYGYKLVCVDDEFSKPVPKYCGENLVWKFIGKVR